MNLSPVLRGDQGEMPLHGSGDLGPAAPALVPLSSGQLGSSQDESQGLCCDTGRVQRDGSFMEQAPTVACDRPGTDARPTPTPENFGTGL